jgi:peptidoglycan-N-acetylglucosamine deacetylase
MERHRRLTGGDRRALPELHLDHRAKAFVFSAAKFCAPRSGLPVGSDAALTDRSPLTVASMAKARRLRSVDARWLLFGELNEKLHLKIAGAAPGELSFRSANPRIAKVSKDGRVTSTGYGWTKITIQADRWKKAVVPVHVAKHWAAYTFDGGPNPDTANRLLRGLKKRHVDATFFLRGDHIARDGNEDIVRRMDHEGHEVGNHSWHHRIIDGHADPKAVEEARRTDDEIASILGSTPALYRPPGGRTDGPVKQIPHPLILWSVASADSPIKGEPEIVYRRIITKILDGKPRHGSGSIILNHDRFPGSVTAALRVIDTLAAQQYAFVTVSDLLHSRDLKNGKVYRAGPNRVPTMKIL